LRDAIGRFPRGSLVPVVLAGTVFAFACGSSSVHVLSQVGKPMRWVFLLALLAVSVLWAAERRESRLAARAVLFVAACFVALALVSALWSVDARLSAGRALSLALLFAVAAALAHACAGRSDATERVLLGLLLGAAAVAVAGIVVLAFDHRAAVEAATVDLPPRYQGMGENPNTASLLLALALPVAAWFTLRPQARSRRLAFGALFLLLDGSIVASVSRGALAAGFGAVLLVAVLLPVTIRARAGLVGVVLVLLAASVAGALIPKPSHAAKPVSAPAQPAPKTTRYVNVEAVYPRAFDVGRNLPGAQAERLRSFLGSGGRSIAWRGALDLADRRPVAGYGFGTEARVFVDRYDFFAGALPENSYIGLDLQLGAVGLIVFLALAGAIVVATVRNRRQPVAGVCLAVFAAGLVFGVVQSYVYSVGNIGTAAVWICGLLGAALGSERAT
jgi:hypothetical protein